jgi:hypothetical protein
MSKLGSIRVAPRGRRIAGMAAIAALVIAGAPLLTATPAAAAPQTFSPNNGTPTTYTVPSGITTVRVQVVGGSGGPGLPWDGKPGGRGGSGAIVSTTLAVQPGEVLNIVVGENGTAGGSPDGGAPGPAGPQSGGSPGGRGGGSSRVTCSGCATPFRVWAGAGGAGGGRGDLGTNPAGGNGATVTATRGGSGFSGSVALTGAEGGESGTLADHGEGGAGGRPDGCSGGAGGAGGDGDFTTGGTGGVGGQGYSGGGGGGGGGGGFRVGGGGGGGGMANCSTEIHGGGAGGGAGFSYVDGGTATVFAIDQVAGPHVTVTPLEGPADTVAPTVAITPAAGQTDPTNTAPILFTATFSEPVEAVAPGDIALTTPAGGRVASVTDTGDHQTFTIEVVGMNAPGTVSVALNAGVTADLWGNPNEASNTSSVRFGEEPSDAPTVTVEQAQGQADPTSASPIVFTAVFSEAVEPLTISDVALTSSAGGAVTAVTPSAGNTVFTIEVSGMDANGTVSVSVPAGVTTDGGGAANVESTSVDNVVTFELPGPACTITGAGDILGTPGDDVICGSAGADRIYGLGGNDELHGFGGNDRLAGGDGDDLLEGGLGADQLVGDAGDDELVSGGGGVDQLNGGAGDDRLDVADAQPGDYALGGTHVQGDTCVRDTGDNVAQCEVLGDP